LGTREGEAFVVAFARGQHGVVSSGQVARAGLGAQWIRNRIRTGWLRRVHRGAYLVGPLESEHSRLMAAVLATGPDSLVGHYPGAVLWDLRPPAEGPVDVIVPRKVRNRPGIRIHIATLHPADVTRRHGIPVTSAARILLDLAVTSPARELDRALNEAHIHHRVSTRSLTEQFSRYPTHRGRAALERAMRTDPKLTRSKAERLMLALVRAARLPEPETNVRIGPWEADLLWRDRHLVVEFDSYAFHSSRGSFERDRRKDRELQALGYTVLRFTWRELTEEREAVVAAISRALAA
jgi:very-short-patch-repair endonuclease